MYHAMLFIYLPTYLFSSLLENFNKDLNPFTVNDHLSVVSLSSFSYPQPIIVQKY